MRANKIDPLSHHILKAAFRAEHTMAEATVGRQARPQLWAVGPRPSYALEGGRHLLDSSVQRQVEGLTYRRPGRPQSMGD